MALGGPAGNGRTQPALQARGGGPRPANLGGTAGKACPIRGAGFFVFMARKPPPYTSIRKGCRLAACLPLAGVRPLGPSRLQRNGTSVNRKGETTWSINFLTA